MPRVFLDTNILVYSVDNNSPSKQNKARDVLRKVRAQSSGVLSTQVLQEFYVVVTRKLSVAPVAAREMLRLLTNYEVITVSVPLIDQAIESSITNQFSFWDALIVASAQDAGCDEVWTEDLQHGQTIGRVQIINPFI